MKKYILILTILLSSISLRADRFVFDMPEVHYRHLRLLSLMNASHQQKDYHAMEAATYQGLSLGTSDSLWTYNLACALTLQNNCSEALDRLQEAIALGFDDLEYIRLDPDLKALHDLTEFTELLNTLQKRLSNPDYNNSAQPKIIALAPDANHNVYQTATNTLWDFNTAFFHSFMDLKPLSSTNTQAYTGIGAAQINALKQKSETNNIPLIIYINRDNNVNTVETCKYPGVVRLKYSDAIKERRLHIGQPNTLFINKNSGSLTPAVGNSSMGFISSAYWRCQPRALFNDPALMQKQITLLMSNQLYCYSTYDDYNHITGDLFSANTPYYVAVTGKAKSEKVFAEAIIAAISALHADTRNYLTHTGLLMPTIQMLLRKAQQGINSRKDYLSGKAHPTAFKLSQLNLKKFLESAATLTTNNIPPLVFIRVDDISSLDPQLDLPSSIYPERLFDTHLAVSHVFRGFPYKRHFRVRTFCKDPRATIRCVILQGDPKKISIEKSADNKHEWMIDIAHHAPFKTPTSDGKSILTTRVDIGVFAENVNGISLPAIVSCNFLGNEKRVYDKEGKLLSIDYRRHTILCPDPLLSYPRNWKDEFKHDNKGRITGWTRIRERKKELFTAYGDLAIKFDNKGRATLARRISYIPRFIGAMSEENDSLPSLAQVDDNITVRYSYASDQDMIGKPEYNTDSRALRLN